MGKNHGKTSNYNDTLDEDPYIAYSKSSGGTRGEIENMTYQDGKENLTIKILSNKEDAFYNFNG